MAEKRTFSVHASIIYNLVVAQAGSLSKSVMECITNSIDAGATKIGIKVEAKGIKIIDDGQGFRSRKEIEDWFEVFGFPHEEGDRVYGKFGIGRAQLWSHCSTIWRTNEFEMLVDIKRKGLDYELNEGLKKVSGVTIIGTFYERLLPSDQAAFERDLADLAKYVQIPVLLNGKQINKDPTKEKWNFDTEDAWVRLSDTGQLAVYNLGMLVKRYSPYDFGSGGVVVTKPGVRLSLNMARNDILVTECKVWKRIRRMLQQKSDERVKAKTTHLSEGELENLAQRFCAGDLAYSEVKGFKLITDIVGRNHSLESFVDNRQFHYRTGYVVTRADLGSRLGERAHQSKLAFVLAPVTLERFGAETVKDFTRKLKNAVAQEDEFAAKWVPTRTEEDLAKAVPSLAEGYEVLPEKDLKPKELVALRALGRICNEVGKALLAQGLVSRKTAYRHVYIGVSDEAEAWTDGKSNITVNRSMLGLFDRGIGAVAGLANLFVHEYLHDDADTGTHTHDFEFYRRYHEATCGAAGELGQAAIKGFDIYLSGIKKLSKVPTKRMLRHADVLDGTDSLKASTV